MSLKVSSTPLSIFSFAKPSFPKRILLVVISVVLLVFFVNEFRIARKGKVTSNNNDLSIFTINQPPSEVIAIVLNLDYRKDRMENMHQQLSNYNISYQRFSAINFHYGNQTLAKQTLQSLHSRTKYDELALNHSLSTLRRNDWGLLGCWQSHLQVYLHFIDGKYGNKPILILEDDLQLYPQFPKYLTYHFLHEILPSDWEMLFLDRNALKCHDYGKTPLRPAHRPLDYFVVNYWRKPVTMMDYCLVRHLDYADAYIIRNAEVAEKLLTIANTRESHVADTYWNDGLFPKKTIRAYSLIIPAANQYKAAFGSDITFGKPQKAHRMLRR